MSGPPCVPDELLEMMARMAGPVRLTPSSDPPGALLEASLTLSSLLGQLLERIWKLEKVLEAVANITEFLKQATLDAHQLVYIKFAPNERPSKIEDEHQRVWYWQPLKHRPGTCPAPSWRLP